jgi:amino-acid N-acetyltransferase
MRTRNAILPDAPQIEALIAGYSKYGTLLPRSLAEICENIRDFVVLEHEGEVVGCGALHLYGLHLAEIRSITVSRDFEGHGAGSAIINALLEEAKQQHVTCVCLFTRIPDFFAPFGFKSAERDAIPDKLYKDCLNCPRINNCDEVAMYRGELPKFAILAPGNIGRANYLENIQ